MSQDFTRSTTNARPDPGAALGAPGDDIANWPAVRHALKEAERIHEVALARGVGTDEQGKRRHLGVLPNEGLEPVDLDEPQHGPGAYPPSSAETPHAMASRYP